MQAPSSPLNFHFWCKCWVVIKNFQTLRKFPKHSHGGMGTGCSYLRRCHQFLCWHCVEVVNNWRLRELTKATNEPSSIAYVTTCHQEILVVTITRHIKPLTRGAGRMHRAQTLRPCWMIGTRRKSPPDTRCFWQRQL